MLDCLASKQEGTVQALRSGGVSHSHRDRSHVCVGGEKCVFSALAEQGPCSGEGEYLGSHTDLGRHSTVSSENPKTLSLKTALSDIILHMEMRKRVSNSTAGKALALHVTSPGSAPSTNIMYEFALTQGFLFGGVDESLPELTMRRHLRNIPALLRCWLLFLAMTLCYGE